MDEQQEPEPTERVLTFPTPAIKSRLQECPGIGRMKAEAIDLIERCSSLFMVRLIASTGGDVSVKGLEDVIEKDPMFYCLKGAFENVETLQSAKQASSLTAGIRTSKKGSTKPSRKRAASSNGKRAAKKALTEVKDLMEDSSLPSERLLPDAKIILDEEDYD